MSYLGDIWGSQPFSDHRLGRIQKVLVGKKLGQTYDKKYQKNKVMVISVVNLCNYIIIINKSIIL